jgi:radical SAM superfamily enzyme YgiQ (UPF0313 family)
MRILYLPNEYSQQRQREKKANIYPVRLAMEAEWYRKQTKYRVDWGEGDLTKWLQVHDYYSKVITEPEGLPFLSLPHPDRVFTKAKEYTSGNYKYLPGTHIMSASGCFHGRCSFCVERSTPYEVREVQDVVDEIKECQSLGFKEIFDDSATFPTGRWLDEFLMAMVDSIQRSRNITFGCNFRIDPKSSIYFSRMRACGFRMLLFGVESGNQETLDKIQKGVKVEDIIPTIKRAAESGLEPHLAVMFGYPWESERDSLATLALVHYLLRKGYAKTAQASLYCPQGVPGNEAHKKYIRRIYNAAFYPEFWWVRRNEDISYLWKGIKSWYR